MEDRIPKTRPSPTIPPIPPPRNTSAASLVDNPTHTNARNLSINPSTAAPPLADSLYSTVVPRSKRDDPPANTLEVSTRQLPPPRPPLPSRGDSNPSPRMKTSSSDSVSTTNLRIRYLEQMVARLDGEKKAMDEEFGRQRKKFMQEMMQAESEAGLAKDSIARHVKEIENLNLRLMQYDSMNSNGGSSQEMEALKAKLQEMSHEQHVKTEQLRNEWQIERKSLETKLAQLKVENKNLKAAAKKQELSSNKKSVSKSRDRSKSPIRRSKSPSLIVPSDNTDDIALLSTSTPAVNFSSESSLESSMLEAAKESELLRTVVIPLEEEIDRLRIQLMEAQQRQEGEQLGSTVAACQVDGNITNTPSPVPSVVTTGEDVSDKDLFEKLLNQERVARQDLEMHADGLRRQKTLLLEDMEKLKEQLQESQNELKALQESHGTLLKTFEQANIEFAQSQDALKKQLQLQECKDQEVVELSDVSPPKKFPSPSSSRFHGNRGRSLSWSSSLPQDTPVVRQEGGGIDGTDSTVSWKPMVEQLQKLMVGLHNDLDRKEEVVGGYQQQLERVQGQLMQDIDQKDNEIEKFRSDHDKIKAALIRERKQRDDLRRQLVTEKETMKSKIEQFQAQENKTKQKLKDIKHRFTEAKHTTQRDMTMFTDERGRLNELLNQKQEEYACLKSLHASEIAEYQQELGKLKDLQKEAEMNVAMVMDELSKVREKESQTEARLSQEISDRTQLLAVAEMEKKTLADQLSGLQSDLIEVQKVNNKLEKECNTLRASRSTLQDKSKAFIEDQQQKISDLSQQKSHFEELAQDLQRQLVQLKKQLETSEANQKDFVTLSQSLQVRLAEIEGGNLQSSVMAPPLPPSSDNRSAEIDNNDDLFT